MQRTRNLLFAVVALTLVVALVAAPGHSTKTAKAQEPGTLLEVAAAAGNFTILLAAVDAAGLTDTLNGEGPYTLFAPSDEVFAALPEATVAALLSDTALLTEILTYHVVPGTVMAADVMGMDGQSATTVEGESINISIKEDKVVLDGNAEVVTPDVVASNGVIHVIDGILVPLVDVDPLLTEGDIVTAGSSTVFPLSTVMAQRFEEGGYTGTITVDSVGTGAGFERFCVNGETDISNASRPIKQEEADSCAALATPRTPVEFRVGTDALAVTVNPALECVSDLTIEQLAQVYSAVVTNWNEINPDCGDVPIALFSPGTDSGTFDYFVEAIFAKDETPLLAANPQLSEDDNVLVQGVEGNPGGIGYFGYAYYTANASALKILNINGVTPDFETAESGEYPLSRPLFIYSASEILAEKAQVADFINFYLTNVDDEIGAVGYFPASNASISVAKLNLYIALYAAMQ
ncbi:MAG: phosphate ABC transporter substrate-binding protein PstS family protein [Chloroflexi bacterium]|nr:phosphate ABC transporter substrate-binding protein PstS family protein [Chloroflexota bacterium]